MRRLETVKMYRAEGVKQAKRTIEQADPHEKTGSLVQAAGLIFLYCLAIAMRIASSG